VKDVAAARTNIVTEITTFRVIMAQLLESSLWLLLGCSLSEFFSIYL